MKRILILILIACIIFPSYAHAGNWIDRSAEIPETVLDSYMDLPYLSFVQSRGNDWLAGNPNRLFHVLPDKTIDLTPDLIKFGFSNIRRMATDGSGWIVIGDARVWQSQPDLAFHYDGMYWKNISHVIRAIPRDEWVGDIAGKQGMWYIATHKNLYAWHTAFDEPVKITVPDDFMEPRTSELHLYPVEHGWIIEFEQKNDVKSLTRGESVIEKRFFFFDGQNFNQITSALGNPSSHTTIGTNGKEMFIIGASLTPDAVHYRAYTTNGKNFNNHINKLTAIIPADISPSSQSFLNQSKIIWTGSAWLIFSPSNQTAIWHPATNAKLLPPTTDTFINAGYGKNGIILLTGYKNNQGTLTPRLVQFQP